MKKIAIFYHSGAGSTKMIGEILKEKLSSQLEVDIIRVGDNYNYELIDKYEFLVFGFPIYEFEASSSMKEFIKGLPKLRKPKKCYIYCTLAFASGNGIRKFAKCLYTKNVINTGYTQFFSPASDASLLLPDSWSLWRKFGKRTPDKVNKVIKQITRAMDLSSYNRKIPSYKFIRGGIQKIFLIYAMKEMKKAQKTLHIVSERCTNCNLCTKVCTRGCISPWVDHPFINVENCEFCLGCVHHCPNKAITTFSADYIDKPRLNRAFFNIQKQRIINELVESKETIHN